MSTDESGRDEFGRYDGAYVLGALSPAERQEFENHLLRCADCARAVRELAGLPGLLSRVPLEDALMAPVEPPPDTLLPALVREVRRRQRQRRWLTGAAAAVAAAAVALGAVRVAGGLGQGAGLAGPPRPVGSSTSTVRPDPGAALTEVNPTLLAANVRFETMAWGTRLDLTCVYGDGGSYGAPDTPSYALVVRNRRGVSEQVATWQAVPGRTTTVMGAVSWNPDDIATVEVRTPDGRPLLRLSS